jgi:hypothetical protein
VNYWLIGIATDMQPQDMPHHQRPDKWLFENELTVDNGQLTVMVSASADVFKSYFRRKFLNCPLSTVNCQLIKFQFTGLQD